MNDSVASGVAYEVHTQGHAPTSDGFDELRYLLFGAAQEQLNELQRHVEDLAGRPLQAEEVARVLTQAIEKLSKQDHRLTEVLAPVVAEAIQGSIDKNPHTLADSLFPVIGPAIRKSITDALAGMLQSFSNTLRYSLSWRGLLWRLEALRTGKSFAEIVMLHTLIYSVEQVFLIHKETGLLLQHVTAESDIASDPDMVSGMLTAIQDFARDSFRVEGNETLDTFQVGELTVWVEQGPQAILATVIRGNPPYELRTVLQDTLRAIHIEQAGALGAFAGDATPFAASRPYLEACLVMQTDMQSRKISPFIWVALGLIFLALGSWFWLGLQEQWRWSSYLDRLRAEPGIVVTTATKRGDTYIVAGLRDPLATDPVTLLRDIGLAPQTVQAQWQPYQALTPEFLLARARAVLEPPATVTLRLEDTTLYASGTAPHAWVIEAQKMARFIPGIERYEARDLIDVEAQELAALRAEMQPPSSVMLRLEGDTLYAAGQAPQAWIIEARRYVREHPDIAHFVEDRLVDRDQQRLETSKDQLENYVLHFTRGTTEMSPGQEDWLQQFMHIFTALDSAAQAVGQSARINIIGRADQTGSDATNMRLSQQRADAILATLRQQDLDMTRFSSVGVGTKAPLRLEKTERDSAFNRSVTFRVILTNDFDR